MSKNPTVNFLVNEVRKIRQDIKEFDGDKRGMYAALAGAEQAMDNEAVDRFAAAMRNKLAIAREKGRGGWDDPEQCTDFDLQTMLREHLVKGDPVDVANFCMMLYHRGART